MKILLVFLGGGFGSVLRYLFSIMSSNFIHYYQPVSTLLSNILSTLIFGLFVFILDSKIIISEELKLFFLFGFCGGFSTFSTFSFETFNLFKQGYIFLSISNIFFSITSCIIILYILNKYH